MVCQFQVYSKVNQLYIYIKYTGNFPVVQCLELHAFTVRGMGSIPDGELRSYKPCGMAKIHTYIHTYIYVCVCIFFTFSCIMGTIRY